MSDENEKHWRGKPFKTPHVWISKTAMDMALKAGGPTCLVVYMGLARAESDAKKYENKPRMILTPDDIGSKCGLKRRCVQENIAILKSCGVIHVESGVGKKYKGDWAANTYTLIDLDSGSALDARSSLSALDARLKKESLSSPSEKERHLSKKSADAGTPPGKPGGSDSALQKEELGIDNF
jgi:hypothetical protein